MNAPAADAVILPWPSVEAIITRLIRRDLRLAAIGDGTAGPRFGQRPAWLAEFALQAATTIDQAAANYTAWLTSTGLLAVCEVPDVFADIVIDWAVQADHARAIRAMQAAIGVRPDGVIGESTRAALRALEAPGRHRAAGRILADRVRALGLVLSGDPTFHKSARAYLDRVAQQIEELAEVAMTD